MRNHDGDVVVSCVDTRSARRAIHVRLFEQYSNCGYWLDLGNQEATANCVLGQPPYAHGRKLWGNDATTAMRYGAFPRTSRRGDS